MSVPIQVRLTAWYAALLAATLIALGAFLVVQLRKDLYKDVNEEAGNSSAALAEAIENDSDKTPQTNRLDLADDFQDTADAVLPSSDAAAQVADARGQAILNHGSLAEAGPLVGFEELRAARAASGARALTVRLGAHRQRYRVLIKGLNGDTSARFLIVAVSLKRAEDDVRKLLVLLVLAGPAALGSTAFAGLWIARRALRPVGQMTSDAEAIRTDRLHERVAVPAARDELRRLAETLNAMLDRIEEGSKQQRRLIADASHELRTPLAVMRSELDVSLLADELPPAARELLDSTREEVDQMSRTVDNLLTLAAADEGRLELLTERLNLREAADRAAAPLRRLAAAREVGLETCGDSWEVRADRQRIHLVLSNLIGNAVKFAGPRGAVRVETWCREGETGVTVTDDGPGVSADDARRLFDRFYRADMARAGSVGGSGLGLAICQEVASAHGGRVWVDSELGKGSAFSFALPAWRALSTEDDRAVPAMTTRPPARRIPRK